ncbi:TetR family transcriptional regulator C-terminal domain-containing protein [Oceanotoga sp. DSM 15011]|jgi:AcrR family transcriptional regulator|uniref:TetR family transcriptional regulator n=1 Tax=Oceanotoga teriensis TaxID=515440 RepID=A0AA45C7X6_9BACT|nr:MULTISPECIES: TetR-like C-terminal domain-containing protein [Oceanotoga]PWJ95685.1 TetR family transcriptional regulator [Oceanotoga teriensis]UYO99517.1 TetR family transcriptional regulator C-terminal domain-containing protein [Oceanotoga sp. DSM 15011]
MAQQYTKKMIRDVFVQMLNEKPFDKITVKNIVNKCKINRKTFYYYYENLYSVLREIFESEIEDVIAQYNETQSWEESFIFAARFSLENKKAIYHVFNSIHREELERYLYTIAGNVMFRYVEDINKNIQASDRDKKIIASFYQSALTNMVLHWIADGMVEKPEIIIRRIGALFDGNISESLKRSKKLP